MYDAIIVGARCGGSAVGLLLARKGYRVLLVDRATFPSETVSGHCILHHGTVRLRRWGLLDQVAASNTPMITRVASNVGDFTLSGDVPLIDDAPAAIGPRRSVLDSILLEAAVAAGAEVWQGFSVTGVLKDSDVVTGIRGRSGSGKTISVQGQMVIGADGKHSKVAQWVQAPKYREVPSLTCWYMSYWSNFPTEGLEMHWRKHRVIFSMATNDGLVMNAVAWQHEEFHEFRSDIEGNYLTTMNLMPDLAERLPDARRETPFYGMADVPGFFRKPYGPGWALVGDAGHHKDPTPAFGISDAFCDAELLVEALDAGFSGKRSMLEALAEYELHRNERAIPDYEFTCQRALLEDWDDPQSLQLRSALRDNPADAGQFFGVVVRAIPAQVFFAPDNISRIMATSINQPV